MKYILSRLMIMSMLACLMGLCACSSSDPEIILTPDDFFTTREVTFDGVAGEQVQVIEFEAPEAWTAEIHSLGLWLAADTYRGDAGKARMTIRPKSDNFGLTAREATLDIYIDGYEAYTIKVYQNSASTGDIQVNGHVDNGVMHLVADDAGVEFCDTLWVTSTKRWTLRAESGESDVLSFETDGESKNGVETKVQVVVKAAYNRFSAPVYEGKFYIQTDEGTAVPITVNAAAKISIHDSEIPRLDETERASYQLVDTMRTGQFITSFYVESNIRWTLGQLPEWLEATSASLTNVTSSGKITNGRHHVSFHLKNDSFSRDGKSGAIELLDMRGDVVKKINITYAGVGSSFVSSNLSFRSQDPYGNPWGFEAKASMINPDDEADAWKEVRHSFEVTTSTDYTSISDAPFHLVMVRADGGMLRKEEVHWARLEMGKGSAKRTGDLYTREIILAVNDRGDADDLNGISDPTQWRHAFVFFVPRNVSFSDLWNGDKLKSQYENDIVLMSQKNDPTANYTFGFEEVKNGGTVEVPARGGAVTLHVIPGSYAQCEVSMQMQGADGIWTNVGNGVCTMDHTRDGDEIKTITFSLSENKKVTNPFTHQTTGSPRHIRVRMLAFVGDNEEMKSIFEFYIDQALNE